MASFVKPMQNFMQTMPFYGNYQKISDQNTPLYQQSPQVPHHHQPTAYDPKSPGYTTKPVQYSPGISRARQAFTKFRRYLKIVAFISNLISGFLALGMSISMIYMTAVYLGTKDLTKPGKSGVTLTPWGSATKTWPTYMLFAASTLTFLGAAFSLLSACCSSRTKTMFSVVYYLAHIGFWAGIAVVYRLSKTGKDLWGWSCEMTPDGPRQTAFKDDLNFEFMCNLQVCVSWIEPLGLDN